MAICDVLPASAFYSTNLNPRIESFADLAVRITRTLGSPLIIIEQHQNQLFEFISIAVEFFSKYTYTEENLIFDSSIYIPRYGIKMDDLLSSGYVGASAKADFQDDLLLQQRKVIDLFSVEEGESTGINTLFTIEQTLAQQTYFSYSLGNYGFDLVSWYVLKEWMETREKLLALKRTWKFDENRQLLTLYPEPTTDVQFYGVVGIYVEKQIKDIIKEPWVYQYALALTKISLGHVRGKYGTVTLFGGGSLNSSDIMTQGITEKQRLEEEMFDNAAGFGDTSPPRFFIG